MSVFCSKSRWAGLDHMVWPLMLTFFPWFWGLSLLLSQGTCTLFAQLKFMKIEEYLEKQKFSAEHKVTSKLQLVLGSCQVGHPDFKQTPSQDQLSLCPTEKKTTPSWLTCFQQQPPLSACIHKGSGISTAKSRKQRTAGPGGVSFGCQSQHPCG